MTQVILSVPVLWLTSFNIIFSSFIHVMDVLYSILYNTRTACSTVRHLGLYCTEYDGENCAAMSSVLCIPMSPSSEVPGYRPNFGVPLPGQRALKCAQLHSTNNCKTQVLAYSPGKRTGKGGEVGNGALQTPVCFWLWNCQRPLPSDTQTRNHQSWVQQEIASAGVTEFEGYCWREVGKQLELSSPEKFPMTEKEFVFYQWVEQECEFGAT